MQRKRIQRELSGMPLRSGFVLATLLPFCIATAQAMELRFGEGQVTGRFDNTLSYGAAVRTQGADRDFAAETDGTGAYAELASRNIKTQANKNDGNNNFADPGDVVSNTVKWNSLLELSYEKYGVQVSGFAFYDKALADIEDGHGNAEDFINDVDSSDVFDNRLLPEDAADYAVSDARLSSAYVWGDFSVGDRTVNVRLGEQVLSWGEALFLQDGINQANPADISALRLPGSEVKDALLPLPMLVVSTSLTDSLSAEAFYEFGWRRSEADPVGTFYSTTDAFFGYGSEAVILDLTNLTGTPTAAATEQFARLYNAYTRGITDMTDPMGTRLSNNKLDDVDPRDDGQYGLALRYLAESLNNTEFGFYFMNYHARKPTAGAVLGEAYGTETDAEACAAAYAALASIGVAPTSCADMHTAWAGGYGANAAAMVRGMNSIHYLDSSSYFLQYEQNLQVWGLTFSTNVGDTSLSGEIAYRPDAEFLPEVGDNLIARNALAASILANGGSVDTSQSDLFGDHIGSGDTLAAGDTVSVSDNKDMLNVSLVAIHNFGPAMGADGLTGVLEVGGAYVTGLDDDKLYAAEGALGYVMATDLNGNGVIDAGEVPTLLLSEGARQQYLDAFSWGYRLVLASEFNDVAAGLNMKPSLRFAQDRKGNGVVGGNFIAGRRSATVAFDFEYSGNWTFGVGANAFWGSYDSNQLQDRDSVYANVKYSF